MKKLIYILLFVISFNFGKAQVWCPPGAIWSYELPTGAWDCHGIYRYEYIGDTLVNSVNCKKICQTYTGKCAWDLDYETSIVTTHLMYADSNKVYYYKYNQFNILYDFSVQIGDTMKIRSNFIYPGCDTIATLLVDSVGVMTINSQNLRYYYVSSIAGTAYAFDCRIVEKIGPFYNLGSNYFFPVKWDTCGLALDEVPEHGFFKCYKDDNFSAVSLSQDSCSFTLEVPNTIISSFEIFPNPVSGVLHLTFTTPEYRYIEIFNLQGQKLFSFSSTENRIIMDIEKLSNGILFIDITNKKGEKYRSKLVKVE